MLISISEVLLTLEKIIGQKFGRLTVINELEPKKEKNGSKSRMALCRCECGKTKSVRVASLKSGLSKSCGCLRNERTRAGRNLPEKVERVIVVGNIGYIYVSGTDKRMLCDKEDIDKLCEYCWEILDTGYARSNNQHKPRIRAHRLVLEAKEGEIVDHINRNRLDNRKENLRIVSNRANCLHRELHKENKTGYAGVKKAKHGYTARGMKNGKSILIGKFDNLEDAIEARRKFEIEEYGIYSNAEYLEVGVE